MDTDKFKICTVINALGSVVGMYSVTIVNNRCWVSELEEPTLAY